MKFTALLFNGKKKTFEAENIGEAIDKYKKAYLVVPESEAKDWSFDVGWQKDSDITLDRNWMF